MEQIVETVPASAVAAPVASLYDLVQKAIGELKQHLNRDGGDIELVAVEGDLVVVDLKGNCTGCVLASVTLAGVRKRLIDLVGRPLRVVPRSALTVPLAAVRREGLQ